LLEPVDLAVQLQNMDMMREAIEKRASETAPLAESPERRQAGDLYRRQPRAEGRRLSARVAAPGGAIMSRAPFFVSDGKLYRWKDILELRRAQLPPPAAAEASQLALFATLHDDRHPPAERTASGRYLQPGLFGNEVTPTKESRP
jgi:hypothetical protein